MTESFEEKYNELLAQAARLPHSDAEVALVEEAVRLSDLHQDARKSFSARMRLVDAANHSGYPEKALVAFTWVLGQHDRDSTIEIRSAARRTLFSGTTSGFSAGCTPFRRSPPSRSSGA